MPYWPLMTTECLTPDTTDQQTSVRLVALGRAKNKVDAGELARPASRRFRLVGGSQAAVDEPGRTRQRGPRAGIRSTGLIGFPGEAEDDIRALADFRTLADLLVEARLDAIGVFGYSDAGDTEAIGMSGKLSGEEIETRRSEIAEPAHELVCQRAGERVRLVDFTTAGIGDPIAVAGVDHGAESQRVVGVGR